MHISMSFFRDGGIDPVTDEEIFLGPLNVIRMSGVIFDMMKKVEAAENHGEESTPLDVVV
jgi:hypothetical protein